MAHTPGFLLLLLWLLSCNCLWHNYDEKLVNQGETAECRAKYSGAANLTSLVTANDMNKWKLWPNLMSQFDLEHGNSLYGFRDAMDQIWKNQHPSDCSNAKFLIAQGWTQGFGSEVHVIGVGLAVALRTKRVFIMNPDGPPAFDFLNNTWQVQNPFCREQGKQSALDCYFEPWTNCKPEDALGGKSVLHYKVHGSTYFSDTDFQNKFEEVNAKIIDTKTVLFESRGDAPDPFPPSLVPIIECSPVLHRKYWWRAVSTAYLLRPTDRALKLMDDFRSQVDFRHGQEQCISIYVRRGDKHVEMKPVHLNYYMETAKTLWEAGLVLGPGGSAAKKHGTVFIGSEDPDVIDQAQQWGKANNWKILFSSLFDRRKDVSTGLDWIKQVKMKRKQQFLHHDFEYFSMLFNLDYHIKCSAFVCTLPSNFCRVIDELRVTVGGKVDRHFAELGIPGCPPGNSNLCIQSRFVNYY